MPKINRRASKIAKAQEKRTAAQDERAKRIAAHAARNKDKPGVHPKEPLINNYTDQELDRFLEECIAEASLTKTKAISQRKKSADQHVFVYDLLQRDNIRRMLSCVLAHCKQRSDALVFRSLDDVESLFLNDFGIDILPFFDGDREELQNRYDTDVRLFNGCHSVFLKRMMVYSMKSESLNCGKCNKPFDGKRYGAGNGEANHIADDTAKNVNERRKSFGVCALNFTLDVCDLIFEVCKIDMECCRCHNKFGACRYDELHPTCEGEYDYPVRLCFEVEMTEEFQRALLCIESLSSTPSSHSFEVICNVFENSTDFLSKDCFLFTKARWDCADSGTRKKMLHRTLLLVQKRMCGECLSCNKKFCHLPGRELADIDLHHIDWDSKLFNPSDGVLKSIHESLLENRKCGPLCRLCHLKVHHKPGENDRFVSMLGSKGYIIDSETGAMLRSVAIL